jgi:drug/metabolite transporter (DMT)-like permease
LNNLLWKKVLQQANSWLIMTFRALLTTLIGIVVIEFYAPQIVFQISIDSVYSVTIASVLGAFGLICMLSALKQGTLRQLGIFNLLIPAFTVSYLFLFEKFNFLDFLFGTTLVIVGFSIYVFQIQNKPSQESNIKTIIYYTLMSLFFASSGLVHWYNFKQSIPPLYSVVNQEIIVFLAGGIGLIIQPKSLKTEWLQAIVKSGYLIVVMAVLIFSAVWTGFLGLQITNPLLASLLPLATPILTILFGALFFKEKWNKKMGLALFIIAIGAYVLHLNLNQY